MDLDKLTLEATLSRHGYIPLKPISPEWLQFALSLVIAESLNSIEVKLLEILAKKK